MCTRFVYRGDNIITGFNFDIDIVEWNHKVINGCVYFTAAGLQEYIAKCTHRAKPVERSATYRKPRSGRS